MEKRRRAAYLVLLGVAVVAAVGVLSAATSQSQRTAALDVQVVGLLQYTNGLLYVTVHDAAGPVTGLREQNIRVECVFYAVRDLDEPPDDGDTGNIHEVSLRNLGDGVYEIRLRPNTPELDGDGWYEGWLHAQNYVVKVYVDGPGVTGTGLCVFHSP